MTPEPDLSPRDPLSSAEPLAAPGGVAPGEIAPGEIAPARGSRRDRRAAEPEGLPPGAGVSPVAAAIAALLAGLGGGYLLFGRAPKPSPRASVAAYAPDTAGTPPATLGRLPVRNLKTLDEWDALDPFAGGFPLPPSDWTPPLLALNPPIPAPVAPLASGDAGSAPPRALGGDGFAPERSAGRMRPPSLTGPMAVLPPMSPGVVPGGVVPEGQTPADPKATNDPTAGPAATPVPPAGAQLVLGTLTGVDLEAGQRSVAALAARHAGAARTFTHMDADGNVEAQGVVLLVAPSDVPKVVAEIKRLGDFSVEDESRGSKASRQSKLSGTLSARLSLLRRKREELLVQFLEDADPVKNIEAAIDKEARAVGAVRLTGAADRLAAIRVLLKT